MKQDLSKHWAIALHSQPLLFKTKLPFVAQADLELVMFVLELQACTISPSSCWDISSPGCGSPHLEDHLALVSQKVSFVSWLLREPSAEKAGLSLDTPQRLFSSLLEGTHCVVVQIRFSFQLVYLCLTPGCLSWETRWDAVPVTAFPSSSNPLWQSHGSHLFSVIFCRGLGISLCF